MSHKILVLLNANNGVVFTSSGEVHGEVINVFTACQ